MSINDLTERVIGLTIKVHKALGPGLLESVYQAAIEYELQKATIPFEREKPIPVKYEDVLLPLGFRCDFLIDQQLILECKAIQSLTKQDEAQILNYLKLSKIQVGLLINFNVPVLKNGMRRFVNNYQEQ